jgi:LmbE family N-acetylglucosaminyl deacetylase
VDQGETCEMPRADENRRKPMAPVGTLILCVFHLGIAAAAQPSLRAVTNHTTYNAGTTVRVRVVFAPAEFGSRRLKLIAAVRYCGRSTPIVAAHPIITSFVPSAASASTADVILWKIPSDARTGRYEIDLTVRDRADDHVLLNLPDAGSFAVHRLLVRIVRIQLNRTFYTSGDSVACQVSIKNVTRHPLSGLRVEFSNRYWPWIAGPAAQSAASIVPLETDLNLAAGEEREIRAAQVAVAPEVAKPTFHQYGVVVWDHARQTALAIAFSPLVMVRPPGVNAPIPYPPQYVYRELKDMNVTAYRHFYPSGLDRTAVGFGNGHTMYRLGAEASVGLSLNNPTRKTWRHVSVTERLLDTEGREITRQTIERDITLDPGGAPIARDLRFKLPAVAGLYRVRVTIEDSLGNILAANEIGLAVNPLPKSIVIFGAHEDDEGGWMGLIRAAVENHIPLHVVYLTSGDAGSCDMYYQRSCGPATALNFGGIRMAEARAALSHLGVPARDVEFLGLPDGGSGEIWYNHRLTANPYLAVLLACDHAPYAGLVEPNLPYARDAVLKVIRQTILKYRPTVIVTAHPPSQGHIDHIVNGYLVIKALQELVDKGKLSRRGVEVLVDRVYNPKTAPFTPYHYANHVFYVSGEVMTLAQEAEWYYESQGSNHALGRVRSYRELPRKVQYRQVLDWMDYAGWNEKPAAVSAR